MPGTETSALNLISLLPSVCYISYECSRSCHRLVPHSLGERAADPLLSSPAKLTMIRDLQDFKNPWFFDQRTSSARLDACMVCLSNWRFHSRSQSVRKTIPGRTKQLLCRRLTSKWRGETLSPVPQWQVRHTRVVQVWAQAHTDNCRGMISTTGNICTGESYAVILPQIYNRSYLAKEPSLPLESSRQDCHGSQQHEASRCDANRPPSLTRRLQH